MNFKQLNRSTLDAVIAVTTSQLKVLKDIQGKVAPEEGGTLSIALPSHTLQKSVLDYLRICKKSCTAPEIVKALKLQKHQRSSVWRIINYACYEGSPVKKIAAGRYQFTKGK